MMMNSYQKRREQLQEYFDATAAHNWERLTSNAPVSRIRATVRAGRDAMRSTLLNYLPDSMHGSRVLDAGCGTGAFSVSVAARGAIVTGIDLSPTLVDLARRRLPAAFRQGAVEFRVGDMCEAQLGDFDHVVAMDSLIHYHMIDTLKELSSFALRTRSSILFTFAPRTPLLAAMHAAGRLFPRSDRAPAIEPVAEKRLRQYVEGEPGLRGWRLSRTEVVSRGFYKSQAVELIRT
jgi:magnesium-protoporphyrin O-methyltransferase